MINASMTDQFSKMNTRISELEEKQMKTDTEISTLWEDVKSEIYQQTNSFNKDLAKVVDFISTVKTKVAEMMKVVDKNVREIKNDIHNNAQSIRSLESDPRVITNQPNIEPAVNPVANESSDTEDDARLPIESLDGGMRRRKKSRKKTKRRTRRKRKKRGGASANKFNLEVGKFYYYKRTHEPEPNPWLCEGKFVRYELPYAIFEEWKLCNSATNVVIPGHRQFFDQILTNISWIIAGSCFTRAHDLLDRTPSSSRAGSGGKKASKMHKEKTKRRRKTKRRKKRKSRRRK